MKKYAIYPGYIHSAFDRQRHYVSASALMHLYGVMPNECVVIENEEDKRGRDLSGLISLDPRYQGDYKEVMERIRSKHGHSI